MSFVPVTFPLFYYNKTENDTLVLKVIFKRVLLSRFFILVFFCYRIIFLIFRVEVYFLRINIIRKDRMI